MPNRGFISVPLRPVVGERFQPTGFPDIGAATFRRPVESTAAHPDGWEECLLVESAQSMANHLEATAWDEGRSEPVPVFSGLPYVRVVSQDGEFVASSRTEAHRLSSAFIKNATLDGQDMRLVIRERLGLRDDMPVAPHDIPRAIMALDPMCLVHGVFFAESAKIWPGQPKVARALTSFVEAYDVERAVSGGVKRDDVRHSVSEGEGAAEGYGFIPFHRTEWVAREVKAFFSLDTDQLASYGLGDEGAALIPHVGAMGGSLPLDRGFRPRTACDLTPVDEASLASVLPSLPELAVDVRGLIEKCHDLLGEGGPVDVVWEPKKSKEKAAAEVGTTE